MFSNRFDGFQRINYRQTILTILTINDLKT